MLTKIRTFFRRYNKLSFAVVAILAGIVFTVAGFILAGQKQGRKVEVTATITNIEVDSVDAETDIYHAYVTYTDKDGAVHSDVLLPTYNSSMKVGDEIKAFYDAENPDRLVDDNKIVPYIFIAVGIAAVILGVFLIVKTIKTSPKDDNDFDKVKSSQITQEKIDEVNSHANEPIERYYFHFGGKLNQSFILETKDKERIMEARCDKVGIVSKSRFTFVNHLTGKETTHEISHTTTTSYNDYVDKSSFKIDGVNCWNHLAQLGYSLDASIKDIAHFEYAVKRYGINVGEIKSAGRNVLKEGKQDEENAMSINGCYIVECRKNDIEGFFTACFVLSRVEVAF